MEIDRKQLKRQAREAMAQAKPAPMLVVLVLSLFTLILTGLIQSLDGSLAAYRQIFDAVMAGKVPGIPNRSWTGGGVGWLLGVALEVMSIELAVGFVIYCLQVWRRQPAGMGNLFDSFGMFFRSIWITVIPSILVSLWSMFYVVPVTALIVMTDSYIWLLLGLPLMIPMYMAIFGYSLSTFIMIENPGLNCFACIAMSKVVMRGYKWKRFVLDLSFLGWILLCLIPVAGWILYLWVRAYMQTTYAGFYDIVMQEYMRRNAPPVEPMY